MNVRLFSAVVLIVALLAALVLPAAAQTGDDPICNGLSAGDCELLTGASKAMDGVTSFTAPEWAIRFRFETPDGPARFEATGTGAFAFDPDAMMPTEGLTMHLDIENAMTSGPDGVDSGSMEIIIDQGMMYLLIDDQWYGSPLESDTAMMPPPGNLGDLSELPGLGNMGDLDIDLSGALTTTRGDDAEFNGQPVAVFTTTVDLPQLVTALLAAPLTGMMGEMMGESGLDIEMPQPEDLQLFGAMTTPMLADSVLSFEQWVGLEDGLIHLIAVDAVFDLDLSALASSDMNIEVDSIFGEFHFMSGVDNINEPLEVQPPENYLPLDSLDGGAPMLDA